MEVGGADVVLDLLEILHRVASDTVGCDELTTDLAHPHLGHGRERLAHPCLERRLDLLWVVTDEGDAHLAAVTDRRRLDVGQVSARSGRLHDLGDPAAVECSIEIVDDLADLGCGVGVDELVDPHRGAGRVRRFRGRQEEDTGDHRREARNEDQRTPLPPERLLQFHGATLTEIPGDVVARHRA